MAKKSPAHRRAPNGDRTPPRNWRKAFLAELAATSNVAASARKAGIATFLPLVAIFYGAQVLISNFWLKRFSYGPLEWVWRALTYGERPAMRRSTSAMIAQ